MNTLARIKRYRPKKENLIKGTPYDSLFEKQMHETVLSDFEFHNKDLKVSYTTPHTYEPDFTKVINDTLFLVETKGYFMTSGEATKYLYIREAMDAESSELVFLWQKQGIFFPGSRKRKDGTRRTNEEWADDHGFRHWNKSEFKPEFLTN